MKQSKDLEAYLKHQKKLMVPEYPNRFGSVEKALKEFKVLKATYYNSG